MQALFKYSPQFVSRKLGSGYLASTAFKNDRSLKIIAALTVMEMFLH